MHILLVEDEEDLRFLITAALAVDDHTVEAVPTGEDALQVEGPFDLVVLDLRLPGIDGFTTFERLGRPRTVMMSAHGDAELRERSAALGALGYLAKPFPLAELRTLVASLDGDRPGVR